MPLRRLIISARSINRNSRSVKMASQSYARYIPTVLRLEPNAHYRRHKIPPLKPLPTYPNLFHTFKSKCPLQSILLYTSDSRSYSEFVLGKMVLWLSSRELAILARRSFPQLFQAHSGILHYRSCNFLLRTVRFTIWTIQKLYVEWYVKQKKTIESMSFLVR